MADAGIEEGDRILITPSVFPRSGEIAMVLFMNTEEATIKRIEFKDGGKLAVLISEQKDRETRLVKLDDNVKLYRVHSWMKIQPRRKIAKRS